jgi:hypothetical protein
MHFGLIAAGCATAALWSLIRFLASLRRNRLVADTPRVRVRSAAQGYVKLVGRAAPAGDAPLSAPLSARACVWWSYEVSRNERDDSRGEAGWQSIDSGVSIHPFMLDDVDASCMVGPINAEITPTEHDVWYGTSPRPGSTPSKRRIRRKFDSYRFTESLLRVGDQLSVMGELRSRSEIDGGSLAAGASAHSSILRTSIISQPANGEPFLIAALDDVQLLRREKVHAALYFCLGLTSVVLCAWAVEQAVHGAGSQAVPAL